MTVFCLCCPMGFSGTVEACLAHEQVTELLAAVEIAAYRAKSPFERASILELSNAVRAAADAGIPALARLKAARRGRKRAEADKVRFLNARYEEAYGGRS